MKFKYDPTTDILLIKLSNEKPDFGNQKHRSRCFSRDTKHVGIKKQHVVYESLKKQI